MQEMETDASHFGTGGKYQASANCIDRLQNSIRTPSANVARINIKRDAIYYDMNCRERGIALIFNHENFDIGLDRRHGTNVDRDNLKQCLEKLNFNVHIFDDLTYEEVMEEVEEVAKLDHSKYDCFVTCILSHGDAGILYAKDEAYKYELLWAPFTADNCPSLVGKPKLFFFQACQGNKTDGGINVDSSPSYRIPNNADFLLAFSTFPGHFSFRNLTCGSWFIQALCAELEENAYKYHLLALMTSVNRRVALDFESNVPRDYNLHHKKQVPYIAFTLTRLVQFSPKTK